MTDEELLNLIRGAVKDWREFRQDGNLSMETIERILEERPEPAREPSYFSWIDP